MLDVLDVWESEHCNKCKRVSGTWFVPWFWPNIVMWWDDRELWLTLPRLFRVPGDPGWHPPAPHLPCPRLSSHRIILWSNKMWRYGAFVPSRGIPKEIEVNSIEIVMGSEQDPGSSKKYWLTRWHMIDRDICSVTSVANSFRAVQLNCDTDKSCLNKQYLWLRRLWAIVAVTPVTKKIKRNEWILEFWTFWSQLKGHFLEINNKN